jgi:hypothetical protein
MLDFFSESPSSIAERDAIRKIVRLRWGVGAVCADSVPGGAVGGACLGELPEFLRNFAVYYGRTDPPPLCLHVWLAPIGG